jgi:mannose-6-phosphate isomerase
LLNRITLQPGQALYLPGGNLHAYLAGVGIEVMANSDNVLRGGLTPKHVDVPELMKVLDFNPGPVRVLEGDRRPDGESVYPTPAMEFQLSRLTPSAAPMEITHDGPQVLLTVAGELEVSDSSGRRLAVPRGRSVWIAASDGPVWVSGDGTAFRATDGLDPHRN